MTAKLQDLVHDVCGIFRGDSKKTKGLEAFNLMKSELEVLETQQQLGLASCSGRSCWVGFSLRRIESMMGCTYM